MKNTGLKLSCLYAIPPHLKGYCGPKEKKESSLIIDFANGKKAEEEKVKKLFIKSFPIVIGYYKIISRKHNLELFDKKVVRAYWTGNQLLDVFFKEGNFIPFHLHHVLTGDSSDEKIRLCQISLKKIGNNWTTLHWGKEIEILTVKDAKNLEKYIQLTLDFLKRDNK